MVSDMASSRFKKNINITMSLCITHNTNVLATARPGWKLCLLSAL